MGKWTRLEPLTLPPTISGRGKRSNSGRVLTAPLQQLVFVRAHPVGSASNRFTLGRAPGAPRRCSGKSPDPLSLPARAAGLPFGELPNCCAPELPGPHPAEPPGELPVDLPGKLSVPVSTHRVASR